jgi:subtilisin family serine protease
MITNLWLKFSARALISSSLLTLIVTGCRKDAQNQVQHALTADGEEFTWQYIENQYIVVYDKASIGDPQKKIGKNPVALKTYVQGVTDKMMQETNVAGDVQVLKVYSNSINGFAATMTADAANKIAQDPRVKFIEKDIEITIEGRGGKPGGGGGGSTPQSTPWGITKVNGGVTYSGNSVAWIIDTGIDTDHPDLNVDASRGYSVFTRGKDAGVADGNGHGTHVAGTVAAIDNEIGVIGVAAGATVIPVKVLNSQGSGTYSGVIDGVDFVAAHGTDGDVANMSLGGPPSQALDDAIVAASANVKFSLAAGNENADANGSSPARVNGSNIYTISAMDVNSKLASFSNYGNPPIDYAAPGVSIYSTWKGGAYNSISGTSMAAPHAAGVLLLGAASSSGNVTGDKDNTPDPIIKH